LTFLLHYQHLAPGSQLSGRSGLLEVIHQLQGVEIAAGEWESQIFAKRISDYEPAWLDELCLAGEVTWARLTPKVASDESRRGSSTPSGATPITFADREDFWTLLTIARHRRDSAVPTAGAAADVYELFTTRGAQFRSDLPRLLGRLPDDVNDGLWDLVARGLAHADSFHAVRNLLRGSRSGASRRHARGRQRSELSTGVGEGRWMHVPIETPEIDRLMLEDFGEFLAEQMIARWGLVTYELYDAEDVSVPWLYVVRALRKFEAQGRVVGGRFVTGLRGEQYASREALELLMSAPRVPEFDISACDPLNLTGGIISGARVPARPKHTLRVGGDSALLEGSNSAVEVSHGALE
jgi:ATP-dependent Lhr-like helicase